MPRYRVSRRFGPWKVGDEFESTDELHATFAGNGLLTEIGVELEDEVSQPPRESPEPPPAPPIQLGAVPDRPSSEQPSLWEQ